MDCKAQFIRVVDAYEALFSNEPSATQSQSVFGDLLSDELPSATSADIASIQAVLHKSLVSEKSVARGRGLQFFYVINATKPDSAAIQEPYIQDLARMLDEPDVPLRTGAIYAMINSSPQPSPKALAVLRMHFNDGTNTGEQFSLIAVGLLKAFPSDATLLQSVLEGFGRYPDQRVGLEAGMMQFLGLRKITNNVALNLIRRGFADPSTRLVAIESVERMPKEIRDTFVSELKKVSDDPDAEPSIRTAASNVLMK